MSDARGRSLDVGEMIRSYPVSMLTVRDPDRNRLVIVKSQKGADASHLPHAVPVAAGW